MLPFLPGTLARHLRDGLLSERQRFTYVLLSILLTGLTRIANIGTQTNGALVQFLLYLIISLIGTLVAFGTNSRGDNRHFIERWLCLHLSLSVLVVYVP